MPHAPETEQFNTVVSIAGGFSVMARLLATPLEVSDVAALRDGSDIDHLEEYLGGLGLDASDEIAQMRSVLADGSVEQVAQRLNIECTRLFHIHLPEPPAIPYESVWREPERLAMGRCTAEVARTYHEAGVHPSEQFADAAPDHIAREMAFVAVTAQREAMALQAEDAGEAQVWAQRREQFMREHVVLWVPSFFEAVISDDHSVFFSAVAKVGNALVGAAVGSV